jgi:hypothetical protein
MVRFLVLVLVLRFCSVCRVGEEDIVLSLLKMGAVLYR